MVNRIQPGRFLLDRLQIEDYRGNDKEDIRNMLHIATVTESMSLGSIRGTASILDTINLLSSFPLRGEETLTFTQRDSLDTQRTDRLSLFAVTDIEPNKTGTGNLYKVHYTSPEKLLSETVKISKAYRGRISDIVKAVFDEFYSMGEKGIEIEDTEGDYTFVIPNMTPERVMHFLAQRAYSSERGSQSFRFFETRDRFYFVTDDYMIEKYSDNPVKFFYNSEGSFDGEGLTVMMNQTISYHEASRADSMVELATGSYKRRFLEVDILNQSIKRNEIGYTDIKDGFPKFDRVSKEKHSKDFVDDYLSERTEGPVIFKDYADQSTGNRFGMQTMTHYDEILPNKFMYFAHKKRSQITIKVYGRNTITAGMVVDFALPEISTLTDEKRRNPVSGKYLIESINNNFVESEYTQEMLLSKLEWNEE
jgi:hypothetical protein